MSQSIISHNILKIFISKLKFIPKKYNLSNLNIINNKLHDALQLVTKLWAETTYFKLSPIRTLIWYTGVKAAVKPNMTWQIKFETFLYVIHSHYELWVKMFLLKDNAMCAPFAAHKNYFLIGRNIYLLVFVISKYFKDPLWYMRSNYIFFWFINF